MACQLPIATTWPPRKRVVGNPADDIPAFLLRELSLGGLSDMLKRLWFAGAERPATPLHFHVAMGREIAIAGRMDLHLLWANKGVVCNRFFYIENLAVSEEHETHADEAASHLKRVAAAMKDAQLVKPLETAVEVASDDGGWAQLADIGSLI